MLIRLSPSSLNLFLSCPRCFWLQEKRGIHRPQTFFPSLPGGMDLVIKDYFDRYRSQGELPPEIVGQVTGKLVSDQKLMDSWRNWKTGLSLELPEFNLILVGALDECLFDGALHFPLDYKTRGSEPKNNNGMELYYRNQLDCYTLLLNSSGFPTGDHGYLVYYYPVGVFGNGLIKFGVKTVVLAVSTNRAKQVLEKAGKCLVGPEPQIHTSCEYCNWQEKLAAEFD